MSIMGGSVQLVDIWYPMASFSMVAGVRAATLKDDAQTPSSGGRSPTRRPRRVPRRHARGRHERGALAQCTGVPRSRCQGRAQGVRPHFSPSSRLVGSGCLGSCPHPLLSVTFRRTRKGLCTRNTSGLRELEREAWTFCRSLRPRATRPGARPEPARRVAQCIGATALLCLAASAAHLWAS